MTNKSGGKEAVFISEQVSRAIIRFAAPTIVSLLVNTFYNIADQIFISHGVGYGGNAAVNVVYPVAIFAVAVSALIGNGASAYMSLSLGRDENDKASDCATAALLLALGSGLTITLAGQGIAGALLGFLAATDSIMDMAMIYLRITFLGIPCVIVSEVLAGLIRADGNPRYAMLCMVPGCLVNVALDALFIFVFRWGVAGAAWATVAGQAVNLIVALVYLPRFRMVDVFRKGKRRLRDILGEFLRLGVPGFINQFASTASMVFINRYLERYGAMSVYGADISLAVFGIMLKVNQLAMCFMNGVAVGMQPVLGYSYGHGDFQRVKACLRTAVTLSTVCGVVFFGIYQGMPDSIMRLFGQSDPMYIEFGVKCFRFFLLATPLFGFTVVSTGLFQGIGKPLHATFMALSRHIIYLLPLVALLTPRFGIVGMLFAGPIVDVFAFITCLVLYLRQWWCLDDPS